MKKLIKSILCVAVIGSLLTGCGGRSYKYKLKVFNWGVYADMEVIRSFQKKYDCKVIYETYDSNESMYTKLLGGNQYDVMVPSDYMIERMIHENLLQKINWNQITHKNSLDQKVLNQKFDPQNEYWVPYFCGNVGIVYDKTQVDKKDLKAGWEILRNKKYKGNIYMYDSERDSMMVALKALGYSMNTTNSKEIKEAYNWLVEQRKIMDPTYATDESIDNMKNGEKALCVMYSGDAAAVMMENPDMGFYMPKEGTNYWFDGFVISKDCKNADMANKFINYMISDRNAYFNTTEVGYLTTNKVAAHEARINDFNNNKAYSMRVGKNDECYDYQDTKTKEMFSNYWTKVKAK